MFLVYVCVGTSITSHFLKQMAICALTKNVLNLYTSMSFHQRLPLDLLSLVCLQWLVSYWTFFLGLSSSRLTLLVLLIF